MNKKVISLALISGFLVTSSTATASSYTSIVQDTYQNSSIGFGNVASKNGISTQAYRTYTYPGNSPDIYSPGTIGIQIVPETPGVIFVEVYKKNSDGSLAYVGAAQFDGGVGNTSQVRNFNVQGYVQFHVIDENGGHGKYNIIW